MINKYQWHRWFAWFPIRTLMNGRDGYFKSYQFYWVWLENVDRKRAYIRNQRGNFWDYRIIEKENI